MECWKDQKLLESISKAQNLSKQLQRQRERYRNNKKKRERPTLKRGGYQFESYPKGWKRQRNCSPTLQKFYGPRYLKHNSCSIILKNMDQIRPLFVYFRPFLKTMPNKRKEKLSINQKGSVWDSNLGPQVGRHR